MKKILLLAPLFAVSISFFYSCNSGSSGDTYTIKMRLNKGDTFNQDMDMNMHMTTAGIETNMRMSTGSSFQVMNSDSAEKELKITYTQMHVAMDMGKLNAMNNTPDSVLNKANKNIIGKSVTIRMSKDNEIVNVSGFEELLNSEQGSDSAGRQMMKKMFSKDQFNSMFGLMFNMYPKKPVKVGESWNGDTKINMGGMNMDVKNKYTLLSVKNGMAEISIDGTLGGNGEILQQSTGLKMDMSGSEKGTLQIRMDNGYLHSGSYKMDMKADMQLMGQKIPMTMKADYTIKGI